MRLSDRLFRLIERIEGIEISGFQWLLIFLSIVVARNFLEQFGPEKVVFNFPSFFLHFPFAYFAPVLALSIILSVLARERIRKVTNLMLFAWLLTLIPPIIDLAIGKGSGERIAYLYVDRGSILGMLVNFFNPAVDLKGTTAGIRIEAFLGCVLSCVYVSLKTRSFWRTVATLLAIYLTFMLFFTLPYTLVIIVSILWPKFGSFGSLYFESGLFLKGHLDRVAYSIALFDLVLIAGLALAWTRLHSKEMARWLFRRFKGFSPIHFSLALFFGTLLALKVPGSSRVLSSLHPFDLLMGLSLLLSVLCLLWVSRGAGECSEWVRPRRFALLVILSLGLLFSGLVGYSALVFSLAFLAFLLLYYSVPSRLPLGFVVGSALLALATLSCMLLGYSTVVGTLVPRFFPESAIIATLLSCFLGFAGWACSVSERKARPVVAFLMLLGFMSVGIVLRSGFLIWAGLLLGAAVFLFHLIGAQARIVSYATYAIFVGLIGFMTVKGELPSLLAETPAPELSLNIERGRGFQIGRNFEHAALEFEQAVGRGWKDPETFFALGFAYQEIGELELSAYWYRRTIAVEEDNSEAYNNLGLVLTRLGTPDSAVAVLRRGIDRDPGSARLLRNLFLALFDSHRFGELIPMLTGYVSANPLDYRMREVLADAYMQVGDLAGAEREYRTVLGSRKGYAPAIVGLGYIMANKGETEEAEKHFLVALQLDPTNVDAMHRLGYIRLERGDFGGAIALFKEAIKQDPLVANHYDSLGDAYMGAGQFEDAKTAYSMAVSLDSTSVHAREALRELEKGR